MLRGFQALTSTRLYRAYTFSSWRKVSHYKSCLGQFRRYEPRLQQLWREPFLPQQCMKSSDFMTLQRTEGSECQKAGFLLAMITCSLQEALHKYSLFINCRTTSDELFPSHSWLVWMSSNSARKMMALLVPVEQRGRTLTCFVFLWGFLWMPSLRILSSGSNSLHWQQCCSNIQKCHGLRQS